MRHTQVLIVGQGLAGTLLAWYCMQHDINFICIDDTKTNAASRVAAGIVHPITGRRLVIPPQFNAQLITAMGVYTSLEKFLDSVFFIQKPIIEIYTSIRSKNDWQERSSANEISKHVVKELPSNSMKWLHMPHGAMVLNGAILKVSELISRFAMKLKEQEKLICERFDFSHLDIRKHTVYKDIVADKVFFCEGAQALHNPLFQDLPFQLCKGEILNIETDIDFDGIINRDMYLLPLGNGRWKVGSNYQWDYTDEQPTESVKISLEIKLQKILNCSYKITDHQAAIRPTVKDRKALAMQHPLYSTAYLINGLGTKGVINGPGLVWDFCKVIFEEKV